MWPFRSPRLTRAYILGRKRELRAHKRTVEVARQFVALAIAESERARTLLGRAVALNDAIQEQNDQLLAELEHYRRRDTEPDQRNTLH